MQSFSHVAFVCMDDQDLEDTRQVKKHISSFVKLHPCPGKNFLFLFSSYSHNRDPSAKPITILLQSRGFRCQSSYSMASKGFGGLASRLRNVTSDSSSGEGSSPPGYDADAERRVSAASASVSGVYIQFSTTIDSNFSYEEAAS